MGGGHTRQEDKEEREALRRGRGRSFIMAPLAVLLLLLLVAAAATALLLTLADDEDTTAAVAEL